MKKLAIFAAAAALSMSAAAPALATPDADIRAVSVTENANELEGGSNWLWLVLAIGAVIGGLVISGDRDAPVSPYTGLTVRFRKPRSHLTSGLLFCPKDRTSPTAPAIFVLISPQQLTSSSSTPPT